MKGIKGTVDPLRVAEYGRYNAMRSRCHNLNHKHYHNYGGRGVTVCDRWLNGDGHQSGFECYLEDMMPRPEGATLDRIDNNRGYSPDNCRWASWTQQHLNKRSNRHIEAFGQTKTLKEWAEGAGISCECLKRRLDRGWSPETAISTVPDPSYSRSGRIAGKACQAKKAQHVQRIAQLQAELEAMG